VDSCDEDADAVLHIPDDSLCDNGLFCDGAEICDPVVNCEPGIPLILGDGVACTDDSCDEASDTIVNAANDANCDNTQFCDGAETCDAVLDCQAGTAPTIDDGVACTDDSCDEAGDVVVNAPNDGLCGNGQFCDGAEVCDPVLDCQAGPGDPCVSLSLVCDENTDACVDYSNDGDCDDGLVCNGVETCVANSCVAGTPPGIGCVEVPSSSMGVRVMLGLMLLAAGASLLLSGRRREASR
jgi:hypothetical protein